ncbi:MoaD/ThiS family protein [Marinobacter halodurans]|uniref:Molybdopterin synthase sulfur carrier subunit n=1 Tax=Marinobacter halodurans TaxID=2528979 RepID=A0ABY1ZME5_9GAMM|nr:MoaD/ThiS family protein [Marinobacter halodurans]TBW55713.1 MoaD/ThiS family protein [Marinobacter halodurans]
MTHTITVRLFAQLRELSGTEVFDHAVPPEGQSLETVLAALEQSPLLAGLLAGARIMTAVNQTMVRSSHHLVPGDELALFPPVTGG